MGGAPHGGASVLMGGEFEKNCRMGGAPPCPPSMGNPVSEGSLEGFPISTMLGIDKDQPIYMMQIGMFNIFMRNCN